MMTSIQQRFTQKVALITGASSGIGEAIAKELAAQGANVVLTGRRIDRLTLIAEKLQAHHPKIKALPICCDVTKTQDLESAVAISVEAYGKIDVVVANAGYAVTGNIDQLSPEDYRRQFETNVFGVLNTIHATLDELKKTKGVLVLIGSVSGYVSIPGTSAYSMSKYAIHGLAHAITAELKPFGIGVVLIVPGFVESEIRFIDNEGKPFVRPEGDTLPAWLPMPSDRAARQIVSAIAYRRRETVITVHGKIAVWIKRYLPDLVILLERFGLREDPSRK